MACSPKPQQLPAAAGPASASSSRDCARIVASRLARVLIGVGGRGAIVVGLVRARDARQGHGGQLITAPCRLTGTITGPQAPALPAALGWRGAVAVSHSAPRATTP